MSWWHEQARGGQRLDDGVEIVALKPCTLLIVEGNSGGSYRCYLASFAFSLFRVSLSLLLLFGITLFCASPALSKRELAGC